MATDDQRSSLQLVGIALLFGIPVGIGIAIAVFRVTGGAATMWSVVTGLAAGLALVVAIVIIGTTGSVDPDFDHL